MSTIQLDKYRRIEFTKESQIVYLMDQDERHCQCTLIWKQDIPKLIKALKEASK